MRVALVAAVFLVAPAALAVPEQGTVVQTDMLGMNLVSYNFETSKTTDVSEVAGLTEFIGLHYFGARGVRVGVVMQLTEYLTEPKPGQSRFATFALLPQVGWHFWGPLFAAFVFTIAPWTKGGLGGTTNFDLGIQVVLGAGVPITERVKLNAAVEVPYNFIVARTIGFTPLLGVSLKLD